MKKLETTSASLHIIAMFFMLCDHIWSTLIPSMRWLTSIGRIAYPIFAFMIVEGFFHTKNFRKYVGRILIFALISEIPFDLMVEGSFFSPYHQNVMWTFLIALLGIKAIETVKKKGKFVLTILTAALVTIVGVVLGFVCFTDYFGFGVLMVFAFYFFHGRKWWCFLGQLICMYWINVELLGGYCIIVKLFGMNIEIVEQGFALLALIPIWLYRGKQGYHEKWFKYFNYAFYPAHMLLLYLIGFVSVIH